VVKIGGGAAPRREPGDPFRGIEQSILGDDGIPQGHSWGVFTRAVTAGLAQQWFSFLPSTPVADWVKDVTDTEFQAEFVENLVSHLDMYQKGVIFPDLVRDPSELGEFVLFSQSTLAPKLLDYFSREGVTGDEIPIAPFGSGVAEVGETTRWLGAWGTSFGTRAQVWFEIRRGDDGTEAAYIFANLCVATRPMDLWLAESFSVPAQAAALLYTAENQFPSSIMTMSRSLSWQGVPEGLIPTPFVTMENFGLVCANLGPSQGGDVNVDFAGYPMVLKAGYLVPETSAEHFDTIVPAIISALTNAHSIIEDGFRNYRNATAIASFDHALGSEYVLRDGVTEGGSPEGLSRWIPETFLGLLVAATRDAAGAGYELPKGADQKALLEWIVHDGANGSVVGPAINTLVYSYLLPAREFERAEELLRAAIAMEVLNESSNAMANLGQVYLAQGKREEAIDMFAQALERFDNFAEAEASYFLGILALEDGDREGAQAFFRRGAESSNDAVQRDLCREKLDSEFG